jgi:hypothetical protein
MHAVLYVAGLGLTLGLCKGLERTYVRMLSAPIGLVIVSTAAPLISTAFDLNLKKSLTYVMATLFLYSLLVAFKTRGIASLPPRGLIFFPFIFLLYFFVPLKVGLNNYLGVINPDFIQSWSFLDQLLNGRLNFYQVAQFDQDIFTNFFPSQDQAKFGLVSIGFLFVQLFKLEPSGALVAAIMMSVTYTVLVTLTLIQHITGTWKTLLLNLSLLLSSASLLVGFAYMFVGQNGGIILIPLLLLILVLNQNEYALKKVFSLSLILLASIVIYIPILPFLILIIIVHGGIGILKGSVSFRLFIGTFISIVASLALLLGLFWKASVPVVKGYFELVLKLSDSEARNLFVDWLSPSFATYMVGFSPSPIWNSYWNETVFKSLGSVYLAITISVAFTFLLLQTFLSVSPKSQDSIILLTVALIAFLVFVFYFFVQKSGFFLFKFSSWFWFLIPLMLAYNYQFSSKKFIPKFLLTIFMLFNFITLYQYNSFTFGNDKFKGTLVNSYGLTDRNDFLDLSKLELLQKSHVALAIPHIDSMIASAYIRESTRSIGLLSQSTLPIDNRNLPDKDGYYSDSSGERFFSDNAYEPKTTPEFIVFPSLTSPNQSVIRQPVGLVPSWQNALFQVIQVDSSTLYSVTGRGLERTEYLSDGKNTIPSNAFFNGFEILVYNYGNTRTVDLTIETEITDKRLLGTLAYVYSGKSALTSFPVDYSQKTDLKITDLRFGKNVITFRFNQVSCLPVLGSGIKPAWCQTGRLKSVSTSQAANNLSLGDLDLSEVLESSRYYNNISSDGWFLEKGSINLQTEKAIRECVIRVFADDFEGKSTNPILVSKYGNFIVKQQLSISGIQEKVVKFVGKDESSFNLNFQVLYPPGSRSINTPEPKRGSVRFLNLNCIK